MTANVDGGLESVTTFGRLEGGPVIQAAKPKAPEALGIAPLETGVYALPGNCGEKADPPWGPGRARLLP